MAESGSHAFEKAVDYKNHRVNGRIWSHVHERVELTLKPQRERQKFGLMHFERAGDPRKYRVDGKIWGPVLERSSF
jgi:hypothetical protein